MQLLIRSNYKPSRNPTNQLLILTSHWIRQHELLHHLYPNLLLHLSCPVRIDIQLHGLRMAKICRHGPNTMVTVMGGNERDSSAKL
jgi:hypothetical protein